METFIRTKTASFSDYWCDRQPTPRDNRVISPATLLASIWITTAIVLILFFNRETMPMQFDFLALNAADLNTPQQVAYQKFANRYKDPSCAYFFGQ